jgi:hypothetical protein
LSLLVDTIGDQKNLVTNSNDQILFLFAQKNLGVAQKTLVV